MGSPTLKTVTGQSPCWGLEDDGDPTGRADPCGAMSEAPMRQCPWLPRNGPSLLSGVSLGL